MALKFSPNVEAGHILQAIALLGAVFMTFMSVRADLDLHDKRITVIERLNDERIASDVKWREQVGGSLKELNMALARLNDSIIRMEAERRVREVGGK